MTVLYNTFCICAYLCANLGRGGGGVFSLEKTEWIPRAVYYCFRIQTSLTLLLKMTTGTSLLENLLKYIHLKARK